MIEIYLEKKLKSSSGQMNLNVKVELQEGKLITVYGKSGAGKSTLLMLLAGLMEADKGFVKVGNEIWTDCEKKLFLAPQKRQIGFVFQEYALFPNMTVRENLLFAGDKGQSSGIIDLNVKTSFMFAIPY